MGAGRGIHAPSFSSKKNNSVHSWLVSLSGARQGLFKKARKTSAEALKQVQRGEMFLWHSDRGVLFSKRLSLFRRYSCGFL